MKTIGFCCVLIIGLGFAGRLSAEENVSAAGFAQKADQLFHQGEYRQAAHLWEKAVRFDPANATYQDGLGRAYEREAESASFPALLTIKARNSFVRALELEPNHAAALEDLIELQQQPVGLCEGDLNESAALIERLAGVDAAAAERAREYHADAVREASRLGQKALCGPVKLTRVLTRPFALPASREQVAVAPNTAPPELSATRR